MNEELLIRLGKENHDKLLGSGYLLTEKCVIDYIDKYDFTAIIDANGVSCEGQAVEIESIAFCYFIIDVAVKYGAKFALERLLPGSVEHKQYSKLNPINWF